MRQFLQTICFAVLFSTGFAAAAPVASSITAVTVYTDRAIVTRSASVELAAGPAEIVFDNLPVGLHDQSLQAAGRGLAGATILDVSVANSFVDYTPNERVKAAEDELTSLQDEVRKLDDRAATLGKQRDFVEKMIAASTGSAEKRPGLDEWRQLYDYTEQTFGKLASGSREIDLQRAALERKKAALQSQLATLRGSGSRAVKAVTVRVSAASAGKLDLSLKYSIPGASWSPSYDARLRTEARIVDLTYYGVVRQSTGEDWTNVVMTLSTARPSLGGAAPAPRRWLVAVAIPPQAPFSGFQVASVGSGSRLKIDLADTPVAYNVINRDFIQALGITNLDEAASWASGQTFGGADPTAFRGPPAANVATAALSTGLTSATFKVATPISVASDNNPQKFAVTTARLDAAIRYEATPKLVEAAFLAVATSNKSDFPFLAGPMNTFLDDNFVAAGVLRTVMPGEKFDLPFGADDGIAIKRKLVNRFNEDVGLANRGARVTYDALITVTNHKKTAETLTFKEAIPVSRDEKVVVKSVAPAERDIGTPDKPREITREADGILAWKLILQPGEKREIPIKLSVEHPADVTVAGLE